MHGGTDFAVGQQRHDDIGESGGEEFVAIGVVDEGLEWTGIGGEGLFAQPAIDRGLLEQAGVDEAVGTVLLGEGPADFGGEVVGHPGACPEVAHFAAGFDDVLDGGEGEGGEVGAIALGVCFGALVAC